jgi:hypothetical protein
MKIPRRYMVNMLLRCVRCAKLAYWRERVVPEGIMNVATEADLRFLRSLERLAPNFVRRQRAGRLAWYLGVSWPVVPAAVLANFAADLPCGYANPVWPYYLLVTGAMWWGGRIPALVAIASTLALEIGDTAWQKLLAFAVCSAAILILGSRRGLDAWQGYPFSRALRTR